MRIRNFLLCAAAALGLPQAARAQDTAVDSRWLAFLGCWEPVESAKTALCIVPAGPGAVDLLTVAKGEVVSREQIVANGAPRATTQGDCSGTQTAEWSITAVRVYLRSTDTCIGAIRRDGSGVIAMTGDGKGEWVYVQGMTLAGAAGQMGVHVQRYREAKDDILLPDNVKAALPHDAWVTMSARAAALAPLGVNDVVEASHALDPAVLQAWLIERGRPFVIDAKKLIALADAGVPPSVIDLLVALSYPRAFAINGEHQGERLARAARGDTTYGAAAYDRECSMFYYLDPYYDCSGRYDGYGYRYGYGYGYPYDWSFGYPVIVYTGSNGGGGGGGGTARPHGRVVNGQGYDVGSGNGRVAQPRSSETGSSTSGSTGTPASGSTSSSSSGSSSSEPRTAHHKP